MSEVIYKLFNEEPYLVGLESRGADEFLIKVEGAPDGYLRVGGVNVKFVEGEAKIPIKKIGQGPICVELITRDGIYKLHKIERILDRIQPKISIDELCSIYKNELKISEELRELRSKLKALSDIVLKTTIL